LSDIGKRAVLSAGDTNKAVCAYNEQYPGAIQQNIDNYGVNPSVGAVLEILRGGGSVQISATPALTPILMVGKCDALTGFDSIRPRLLILSTEQVCLVITILSGISTNMDQATGYPD
jgi:hypothetical protein